MTDETEEDAEAGSGSCTSCFFASSVVQTVAEESTFALSLMIHHY